MKTIRELGSIQRQRDLEDFSRLAAYILGHGGSFSRACQAIESKKIDGSRLMPRLSAMVSAAGPSGEISRASMSKAAVSATGLTSPLQDLTAISSAFVASLASYGVFDEMLPFMAPVPTRGGSVGASNVTASGYSVLEGLLKPVSKLSLTGTQTSPTKVHCALIITQELARMSNAVALIQRELQQTVAIATDTAFINSITSGVVPAISFGPTASNVRADIEYLLRLVAPKANSKPFLLTTPAICRTLSQMNNSGEPAFPDLGPLGGEISPGLPLLVSDAVNPGYLVCIDASRIAGNGGEIELSEITEASMQLEDSLTVDSPPTASTNFQSLWQLNLTGIRLERWMLAQKLTSTAVGIINNVNSYVVGAGSP